MTIKAADDIEAQKIMDQLTLKLEIGPDNRIIIDCNLTFDKHISAKINKANSICGLIRRTMSFLDMNTFKTLFTALVRPHLEYGHSVWYPYLKRQVNAIENVQRRASKLVPGLKDLSYEERLRKLKLPTLAYRRYRGDMIEMYKLTHSLYDDQVTENFLEFKDSQTRGASVYTSQAKVPL